ncbi:unnamed protein product [Alopecurus aequalis]
MGDGGGSLRRVARLYLVLGLATACFALYAISLDPAPTYRQLQQLLQMIKDADKQQLEQGQGDCAAKTAAAATEMRADAAVLLLLAASLTMTAMVAVAGTSRLVTVCAQIQSIPLGMRLLAVLAGVVDLAIGSCHGHGSYHQLLVVAVYCNITVSFVVLFIYGLLVAFRGQV